MRAADHGCAVKGVQPFAVWLGAQIHTCLFQQVKRDERIADTFAVDDELHRGDLQGTLDHELGQGDDKAHAVDTNDSVTRAADQHPLSIDLLLHEPPGIGDQLFSLGFVDGIEQLGQHASGTVGFGRLLIWRAVFAG